MNSQPDPITPIPLPADREKRLLYWAAGFSTLAGLIHAWFAPEHFEEWFGYGLFFVIAAAAQLIFALLLLIRKPTSILLLAGIIGNALIITLYLLTRNLGIPLGPHAGEIEAIGTLDAIATFCEIALIICLLLLLKIEGGLRTGKPN